MPKVATGQVYVALQANGSKDNPSQQTHYIISNILKLPITAIVLTFNEEKNIEDCLQSIYEWVEEIFIVDSYSTDKTLELAAKYTANIVQHPFENYGKQRNWALENLPVKNEWIMNIDADHRATPELRHELSAVFEKGIPEDKKGFMASRKTMFLDRWIKYGGHYPTYHAIIFKKGFGHCEDKNYDQHFVINGPAIILKGDVVDIITDSLTTFTQRHNKWATLEAEEAVNEIALQGDFIKPKKDGNPMEQRRYMKHKYYSYPMFTRVVIYFIYRYIFKRGFLDGKEGLVFHFLQGFWFRFLVDAKIYELKKMKPSEK